MSRYNLGIVAAMESETDAIAVMNSENLVTSDLVDNVEEPVAEIEGGMAQAESAMTDVDTLEKIEEGMQASVDSGEGMDPTSAKIAEVAIESICRRLGIDASKVTVSSESFGSRNTRMRSTNMALEGIGDAMSSAWRAIKAMFKKVMAMIKNAWMSLTDGATKLEAAAKAVAKRAITVAGTPDESELEMPSVAGAFAVDRKFEQKNVLDIVKNHIALTDNLKQVPTKISDVVKSLKTGSDAEKSIKVKALFDGGVSGISTTAAGDVAKYFGNADDSNIVAKHSPQLVGNRALYLVTNKGDASAKSEDAAETSYLTMFAYALSDDDNDIDKVDTLSQSNIVAIAGAVERLAKSTIALNKESKKFADLEKNANSIFSTMDRAAKQTGLADGDTGAEASLALGKTNLRIIRNHMRSSIKSMATVGASFPKENIRAGRLALDYCNRSISQYKTN